MINKVTWDWVDYSKCASVGKFEFYTTSKRIVLNSGDDDKDLLGLRYVHSNSLWVSCDKYTDDNIQYYFNMAVLNMVNGFLNTGEY